MNENKLYSKWFETNPEFFEDLPKALAVELAAMIDVQEIYSSRVKNMAADKAIDLIVKLFKKTPILKQVTVLYSGRGNLHETSFGVLSPKTKIFESFTIDDKNNDELSNYMSDEVTSEIMADLATRPEIKDVYNSYCYCPYLIYQKDNKLLMLYDKKFKLLECNSLSS